jgi:hypothetical protein
MRCLASHACGGTCGTVASLIGPVAE